VRHPRPVTKAFKPTYPLKVAEFDYGWSAEVSAISALVTRFRTDMHKRKARISLLVRSSNSYWQ
jgi:hypothetical protein